MDRMDFGKRVRYLPSEGFLDRLSKELFIQRASIEVLALNTGYGPSTVVLARVGEEAASMLSNREGILVPPHVNVISVGWATKHGTEAVTRIPSDETEEDEASMVQGTASFFALGALCQESGHKYRSNESSQYMGWDFEVVQPGLPGALLVADPLLKGFGSVDEDNYLIEDEDEVLADSDGWPAHFICLYPLLPKEWAAAPGVRTTNYIGLVRELWSPVFLATPKRCEHTALPGFSERIEELRAIMPAHYMADNADMQIRLRNDCRSLDLIVSRASLLNLITPFDEVFNRDVVPKGCRVGMEAIGLYAMVRFYARLDHGEGEEVTPDTAQFILDRCLFDKADPESDVEVPTDDGVKCMMAALSLAELASIGLIRRMEFTVYAPKQFMGTFLTAIREISLYNRPPGHGETGSNPHGSILEFPGLFSGSVSPGGLLSDYAPAQSTRQFPRSSLRVVAVPMDYQLRPYRMNDSGSLDPSLESLGLVPHTAAISIGDKQCGSATGYYLPDGQEISWPSRRD